MMSKQAWSPGRMIRSVKLCGCGEQRSPEIALRDMSKPGSPLRVAFYDDPSFSIMGSLRGRWYTFDARNNMPRIGRVLRAATPPTSQSPTPLGRTRWSVSRSGRTRSASRLHLSIVTDDSSPVDQRIDCSIFLSSSVVRAERWHHNQKSRSSPQGDRQ